VAWEDVELPVLNWVFESSRDHEFDSPDLPHESSEPSPVPGVAQSKLDDALSRLTDFGLVDGRRGATFAYAFWTRLRPTAAGLRVLGEWPPTAASELNQAVVGMLRSLAEASDDPEAEKSFRRAAAAVARFGEGVVVDLAKAELRRLGGEVEL
jgi:hypothetical protein